MWWMYIGLGVVVAFLVIFVFAMLAVQLDGYGRAYSPHRLAVCKITASAIDPTVTRWMTPAAQNDSMTSRTCGHTSGMADSIGAIRRRICVSASVCPRQLPPPAVRVLQERLQAIDGVREARLRRLMRLELVPQLPEIVRADRRAAARKCDPPPPARAAACASSACTSYAEHISRVDLDEIVDGDHLHHAHPVDAGRSVFAQHHDDEHEMPRMFGGVFEARRVDERRAPNDGLELVRFDEKGDLLGQARGVMRPLD